MTPDNDDTDPHAAGTATCDCCGPVEADGGSRTSTGRWLGDDAPLATDLPSDLRTGLGRVIGEPPIATLGEWLAAVRERAGDGGVDVDRLCHADDATPHVGRVGEETYHFRCVYDAVVLAALLDEPVSISTESPDGTAIEAEAVGTEMLDVVPGTAVFSVGVADDVAPPDGEPDPAALYGAVCPYVRAFPDRAAYQDWAETAPAATAALPLDGATEFAAVLVE